MNPKIEELEVLCFGCVYHTGHSLNRAYQLNGNLLTASVTPIHYGDTPWGNGIDAGLLKGLNIPDYPDGTWVECHKADWTAVAFWDRSGDSRPNSNTVFLVLANIPGKELIERAKLWWPQVFERPSFPKLKPEPETVQ